MNGKYNTRRERESPLERRQHNHSMGSIQRYAYSKLGIHLEIGVLALMSEHPDQAYQYLMQTYKNPEVLAKLEENSEYFRKVLPKELSALANNIRLEQAQHD